MPQGRPKLPPRAQIILRIDERLILELYTLRPKIRSAEGGTRYGALNKYFTELLVRDLESVKKQVRASEPEANG